MYKKQQGCTKEVIDTNAGYTVDVWVPPLGYGFNSLTGEIEKTDIIKRSNKAVDQYWERLELPKNWKKLRAKEKKIQLEGDPDHFDSELEDIRATHWTYRLCGVWVYMNGKPVYLTGEHWMYLNWWNMGAIGYPEYRDCDRRRFYFEEYCNWDPRCAGILEASNRRSGKSFRAGLFLYNYISISHDTVGGIQSKTDIDAGKFFAQKLISPFKKLPDFFQPDTDTTGGAGFKKSVEFKKITRRGRAAMDDIDDMGLNSVIDYQSSNEFAYDGQPLHRAVNDEVAKKSTADAFERWKVIRYCLVVGKKFIGKAICTTTPEELEGMDIENTPFYKLWHKSLPIGKDGRDENGRTGSWLYAYLMPAWETIEVDKYGMPNKDKNIQFIHNTRNALKGKLKDYLDEMKKNCLSVDEMFRATLSSACMYDEENLTMRIDTLTGIHDHYTRGDFIWENGERDTKVLFVPAKNGRWLVLNEFTKDDERFTSNMVEWRGNAAIGGTCRPLNVFQFTAGVDPFDHDLVESGKGSNGAISIYQKYNPHRWLASNKGCVCLYLNRPPTSDDFYEDCIKTFVWFGCDFLFETQKIGIKKYVANRGYDHFMIRLAGNTEPGCASSPTLKQHMSELIEWHIKYAIESFFFMKLLTQLVSFDIKHTEKFDAVMAYGYSLIADGSRLIKNRRGKGVQEISRILPAYLL